MEPTLISNAGKNTFKLPMRKQGQLITVSSDFDSGNMSSAELGLNNCIVITPANDCASSDNPSHSKGWFYFRVSGVPLHTRVKFIIKKMQQLSSQMKFSEYFKPVCRAGEDQWERVQQSTVFTKEDDTQLHFQYSFNKNAQIYFAYTFPFSYHQCESMLKNAIKQAKMLKGIYYKDEILIKSPQGRLIHLLTVSSTDEKEDSKQSKIDEAICNWGDRPYEFKITKRIIIISARVHPGQAPSSHTFNGILKFLLSNDARAHFLRKNFVFKLIPMLNPDGVAHGHYRMDIYGQNLNRFYQNPDLEKQPSVYAVRKLGQYYQKQGRLCFYMDLHAHPQRKGNFIYGNAFDAPELQVQAQLYARLLSLNCPQFQYWNSSFSKYHMNAKDKNEDLTKQGCGRVVFNTHFELVHAFTMECGYTCSSYINEVSSIENAHRKFQKYPINYDELENLKSAYYSNKKTIYFTIKSYENLGKNVLVSILDLFELNPASRIPHTSLKNLAGVKQQIYAHLTKGSSLKKDKFFRWQPNNPVRIATNNDRQRRGYLRAPSIQSTKQIGFNRLRNRTLAKVNIGFL